MFRKGVVACVLGGALVSATLPGSPLLTEARARKAPLKKQVKMISHTKNACGAAWEHRAPCDSVAWRRRQRAQQADTEARSSRHLSQESDSLVMPLGAFSVTAYTHYRRPRGGVRPTASGVIPRTGRTVAVDPRVIPLGSRIHIPGLGERIAEDTGKKIKGKRLDLFLPSARACRQFGIQRQDVYILTD